MSRIVLYPTGWHARHKMSKLELLGPKISNIQIVMVLCPNYENLPVISEGFRQKAYNSTTNGWVLLFLFAISKSRTEQRVQKFACSIHLAAKGEG